MTSREKTRAKLQRAVVHAQATLQKAERELASFELRCLAERPPTDIEIARLGEALRSRRPLCCKEGRAELDAIVADELWRERINSWAYQHLSCGSVLARESATEIETSIKRLTVAIRSGEVARGDL